MRLLIAFEGSYRVYANTLAMATRTARPHLQIATTTLQTLQSELVHFDPHLVICSSSNPAAELDGRLSWVQLSGDSHRVSKFYVNDRHWESLNPSLAESCSVS